MPVTTADELRTKEQLYYDDVEVGQDLPSLEIGPMTTVHAFRWSAAIENWHKIHYDQDFSVYHDGLPNILIQGSWKQSIMPRYLKDLCLPNGWMWKVSFQHRAMIVPGDLITCWAKVTDKYEKEGPRLPGARHRHEARQRRRVLPGAGHHRAAHPRRPRGALPLRAARRGLGSARPHKATNSPLSHQGRGLG